MAAEFDHAHDHFRLVGEDNFRRYLPLREVRVRYHTEDTLFELFTRVLASRTAGCNTVVSIPAGTTSGAVSLLESLTLDWAAKIEFVEESDEQLAEVVRAYRQGRIRFARPERVPPVVRAAAATQGTYLAAEPVVGHGRVELLWYFREQSLTHVYHRYGNLGIRSEEPRADVL